MLRRNEVPNLKALRLHNGTIYRWTRPCYGISEGRPASADREPDPALRPEHRRRSRQRRLLVRAALGAVAGLSRHPQGDGVRHRQRELRRRRPPRPARPVRLAGAPAHPRRRADSRGAPAGRPRRSQVEGHRSGGCRPLPRHRRGARPHQEDGRAVAARQLQRPARSRQPRRAARRHHRRDHREPEDRPAGAPVAARQPRARRRLGEALRSDRAVHDHRHHHHPRRRGRRAGRQPDAVEEDPSRAGRGQRAPPDRHRLGEQPRAPARRARPPSWARVRSRCARSCRPRSSR